LESFSKLNLRINRLNSFKMFSEPEEIPQAQKFFTE